MNARPNYTPLILTLTLVLTTGILSNTVVMTADDKVPTVELVEFSSPEGMDRFATSNAKVDFFILANQFEGQGNGLYCGPTTAAIVLNAFRSIKHEAHLPRDRSQLTSEDLKHLPKDFDPTLPRYTQNTVIEKSPKARTQVFGKPIRVNGKEVHDFGYQLRQMDELLKAHGLRTQLRVTDEKMSDDVIGRELVENLRRRGDFVIVNYKRSEVGQKGGGHISPVAAYDLKTDSFLILDVNPSRATWVWMPAPTLIKGMRSFDTLENRGYILVSEGNF